ncbi:MAG: DUF4153 domain-containing protein [Chloroflexota bacterium]|nr:DUF4173 domain-containing protein [Chloroflexota bacterium]MBI5702497.1 DUF4173 domain-containing protein [Chloroflexota bacterium]
MKTNPNRFWFIVILLGWMFDFLFWEKPGVGINFFLYVSLCLGAGIYLLKMDGLRLAPRSSLLLLPIAFLSAVTFIRQEPLTTFLSIALTLFLMGVFAIVYRGGQWLNFSLLDYLFGYLRLFGSMLVRPIGFGLEMRKEQPSLSQKRSGRLWAVIRGIVIALPVVAVFASLLSSADLVFEERINAFLELFNIENLPEYIFRLVYILVAAYALAGTYLHAAQKSDAPLSEKPLVPAFLGFTEAAIVLGSVAVLFALFVIVQFQYFFGGQANIAVEGYTYSEYARRGFGELTAVAFFSLLLLLGLGAITKRENEVQRKIFSGLGVGLVALVIVMLVSAFQRLTLYEFAYGFSRLRTYTHVFLIWLGLLLIAIALLEAFHRERAIALTMLLAALGFVVSLSVLNVDAFIVRQNIQREAQGGGIAAQDRAELDARYFLSLSDDAVPAMADAFLDPSLPAAVREKVGAVLVCMRYERELDWQAIPWQAFHLSRHAADASLREMETTLQPYELIKEDRGVFVKTPSGGQFDCWGYSPD